MYLPLDLA
jgi:hypothetical protein